MTFSLINVQTRGRGKVSGNWVQDVVGSLGDAFARARAIEQANGGKISVAVVNALSTPVPGLTFWTDLTELEPRNVGPLAEMRAGQTEDR